MMPKEKFQENDTDTHIMIGDEIKLASKYSGETISKIK